MSESEEQYAFFGGRNGLAANIPSLNYCSTSRMRGKEAFIPEHVCARKV